MEKAIWNDEIIYASEVKNDWGFEKLLKLENKNGVLKCPDKSCSSPIMIYCHGKERRPYFAHKHKSNCDYDRYEKTNTELISSLKVQLYDFLREKGVVVDIDVKMFDHQYAHVVCYASERPFALEFVEDKVTSRRVNYLSNQYQKNNISMQFLLIADDASLEEECDTNFIRRFSLNESHDKSLLIISKDGTRVYQHRFDEFEYKYHGSYLVGYPSVYSECAAFDCLTLKNNSLVIDGFSERYNAWFEEKQKRYKEFITPKRCVKPNIQNEAKIDANTCSNESLVCEKEIISVVPKTEYDTTEVKDVRELKFIEDVSIPLDKPAVELFVWKEADFINKINQVCYEKDSHAFKLLLNKFRIVNDDEKAIINKLWIRFKEQRPDYFYILKSAHKKMKNL